jgi:glycosyltransferase involved in cell wall biosynthesis
MSPQPDGRWPASVGTGSGRSGPPPITGHSLVSQVLRDDLARDAEVSVVDLAKDSFTDGADSLGRVTEVLGLLWQVLRKRRGATRIYLTISESLMGNLKDLLIYAICFRDLPCMYIHLHGGSIKRLLWDRHPLIHRVNRFFIRRMGGVIVSGRSHLVIFDGVLPPERVHIVTNFAQEYLFVTEGEIRSKFESTDPLRILYISNFIPKKGYGDLVEAYLGLDEETRRAVRIDFAGKFDSPQQEAVFLERISGHDGLHYHGMVDDARKRALFVQSHIFCLPTALFEGQPISILEAYAAGCVVVTTGQSGIRDVFSAEIDGYEIEPEAPASIRAAILRVLAERDRLLGMGLANNRVARERYRAAAYTSALRGVMLAGADAESGARRRRSA